MNVVIVLRSCPDYTKMNDKLFGHQLNHPFKPHTEIKRIVEANVLNVWKEYFSYDLFKYRHEIANIAKVNVQNTGCQFIRSIEEFEKWFESADDALIVPVDDDDWFSPDIKNFRLEEQYNVVCWGKITCRIYTKIKFYERFGFRLGSNNWAVRKSWLSKFDKSFIRHFVFGSHRHSETCVEKNLTSDSIKIVNDKISVHLRHVGSLSLLRGWADGNILRSVFQEIYDKDPVFTKIPEELKWTETYLNMAEKVSLKMKRKLIC